MQGNIQPNSLFQLLGLFFKSLEMFPGRLRLFPSVRMSTPATLASSQIFSIITHLGLACNAICVSTVIVVSNIIRSVSRWTEVIPEGQVSIPVASAGSRIFSQFMQECLGCKVIFNKIYCFNCCSCFLYHGK